MSAKISRVGLAPGAVARLRPRRRGAGDRGGGHAPGALISRRPYWATSGLWRRIRDGPAGPRCGATGPFASQLLTGP